ncbi:hypothetical protein ASPWEDRAFT_177346 [Aspergillus wentii DTO 134E9]|uniref:Thioesterase domain-containing protein n=1 Tax=Aspergillus wentii DTO 134E9 TaxID=1073089 RepID=A0A1L9R709_ASPWE|nr:uncharacterized protein ASPWEDRAFT_177346 [Aspergillus wentii DTO 134E9]KAI9926644.1 hypothetical protein MW887_003737 [Aspergillus wentii]OJJ30696.1 hypothetical protein ASPWEDRAFT_177346 [Aspergillus wentii DTO 134E9]
MSTSLQHVHAVWDKIRTNSPIYDFLLTRAGPHPRKTPHRSPALASHGRDSTGLSTDLHVSFVAGAKEGETLEVEGRTNKMGKTLTFTNVTIWKGAGQSHTRVVAGG